MKKLPVSVIAPVRNCIQEAPAHARHLGQLAEIAAEVLVVDSDSSDGTADFLRKELADSNISFHNHPPGLYQSWNHGISQAGQPYCTVATVGDILPPDSLKKLIATMDSLQPDVLLSAPTYLDHLQKPIAKKWPLHELIELCGIETPAPIDPVVWILLTTIFFPGSLMGSSASNIYRTAYLQQNPFPADYGHSGDSVWGFEHSLAARFAVDPRVTSYFWLHEEAAHKQRKDHSNVYKLRDAADRLLLSFAPYLLDQGVPASLLESLQPFAATVADLSILKIRQGEIRKKYLPDLLQPEFRKIRKIRKRRSVAPLRQEVKDYVRKVAIARKQPSFIDPS